MAPQKGGQATKQQKQQQQSAGTGNVKKPVASHATAARSSVVVPAIPLPMINRQASTKGNGNGNTSTSAKPAVVSSSGYPVASLEAALIDQQAAGQDSTMPRHKKRRSKHKNEVKTTNGTHVEKPDVDEAATKTTNGEYQHATVSTPKQHSDNKHVPASGTVDKVSVHGIPATNGSNGLTTGVANITFGDNIRDPAATSSSASTQLSTVLPDARNVESAAGPNLVTEPQDGAVPDATTVPVPLPENTIQATDLMTPNHGRAFAHANDAIVHPVPVFAGQHALPHVHHNGNAIMFGGAPTPDSHTPSPASGAFMPPPPRPLMNGVINEGRKLGHTNGHRIHHGHVDSHGNNFGLPTTPFRTAHDHVTSMDSFGNVPAPVPVHRTPLDGFPPNAAHYEPPTPHSFHGSQASGDFNGFDSIVSITPNGHGFEHDHRNGRSHGAPHLQPLMPPPHTRRPSFEEEVMDSVIYFQNQFNSPELADCTLELKFLDGHSPPAKIHAHKLILARSPALKHYIMIARAADPGSHVLTLNATDRYLRSDAWFTAVQRLYLHPLFTPPNGADLAGSNIDQFRFCLAYAAAGHTLEMGDVLLRGLHIAAGMVNWHTIEEALGFAFDGAVQRQFIGDDGKDYFDIEFNYGRDVRVLMASVTNFIINYFPPNFELDTTVTDSPFFARIPAAASNHFPVNPAPAIARGSSVRKPSKGNRLSVIKFGDLPTAFPEEDVGAAPREPAKCSLQLSRILLNLPFEDLKYVLASQSNTPQGWNTAQDRFHALAGIVAEREARRLRAVEAVRANAVPGSREIQQRLSASRRYDMVDAWDVLNWQEEVRQPNGAGIPTLVRTWIPQFHSGVAAERTQTSPSYVATYQESMV